MDSRFRGGPDLRNDFWEGLPNARRWAAHSASPAESFAKANRSRFISELQEFVRIPSVSGSPARAADVKRCAAWLAAQLKKAGMQRVRIVSTARHPIVYAAWNGALGKPTVLIYGHYDVQPAEPLADWSKPPYAAISENGFLYGRGASDDKGQLFAHVKAIESCLRTAGRLPLNVKCLFEGEEEIGSPNLFGFIARNRIGLQADAAVISDTRMLGPNQPALTYALRGQLAMELEVRGPDHDLHSGSFGGAVHEPIQVLCEMVARLHDRNGRIAIPGFYDSVREWSGAEREYLARSGPSDREVLKQSGVAMGWGEKEFSVYERLTLRPSLSVTGFTAGHSGPGPKGVIPCRAAAKLSFRLVPDQDPKDIERRFRGFIQRLIPPTVTVSLRTQVAARSALIQRHHPAMRAAFRAYRRSFGRAPVWVRSGGSIPIVSELRRTLGVPTVLLGFASPEDGMHGPNEKFSLKNFERGILTSTAFLEEMGRTNVSAYSGRGQYAN